MHPPKRAFLLHARNSSGKEVNMIPGGPENNPGGSSAPIPVKSHLPNSVIPCQSEETFHTDGSSPYPSHTGDPLPCTARCGLGARVKSQTRDFRSAESSLPTLYTKGAWSTVLRQLGEGRSELQLALTTVWKAATRTATSSFTSSSCGNNGIDRVLERNDGKLHIKAALRGEGCLSTPTPLFTAWLNKTKLGRVALVLKSKVVL
eukprot:6185867-Pleurochrysis_carterae.AAC.4